WVEAMSVEQQNSLFMEVAKRMAERLKTSLHGLVVHLDETAIHAHFQLAATSFDGRPVSKIAQKSTLNDLQTIAAEVGRKYDDRIERGHRKLERLAAGASPAEVVYRSEKRLHEDLPREEAAKEARVAELNVLIAELEMHAAAARAKLEKNERLAARALEKVAEEGAKAEKAAKNAAIYERRADEARRELADIMDKLRQ